MSSVENEQKEISVLNVINILMKNFKLIFIITLVSMVTILTLAIVGKMMPPEKSFMPDKYSPTSIVMLNSSSSSGGLDSLLGNSGMGALAGLAGLSGGEGTSDIDLAKKLATTDTFIQKLNNTFNLDEKYETITSEYPKTALKNIIKTNLQLKVDELSGLLEISYTDIDKYLATDIVNEATSLLEEEFTKIDIVRNKSQLSLAEDNKQKLESEMEWIARETIKFQKKHNLIDVDIVFEQLMRQMSTLQTSLLNKEIEIENYKMISSIKDPGYKRLINERLALENAISKLESGKAGNFPPVAKLPELALELQELKADMAVKQAVYKTIVQQYEALKLTSGGTGPTFQVIEKAMVPEIKSEPSRGKICIIGSVAGFFLSLLVLFFKELWADIKSDPEKLKKLKGKA